MLFSMVGRASGTGDGIGRYPLNTAVRLPSTAKRHTNPCFADTEKSTKPRQDADNEALGREPTVHFRHSYGHGNEFPPFFVLQDGTMYILKI